jgi:hypothetical protein
MKMSTETVDLVCGRCQTVVTLSIDLDAYHAWKNGALIQEAFPTFTTDERKMIMTRTCGDCWNDMWNDEAEEEFAAGVFE